MSQEWECQNLVLSTWKKIIGIASMNWQDIRSNLVYSSKYKLHDGFQLSLTSLRRIHLLLRFCIFIYLLLLRFYIFLGWISVCCSHSIRHSVCIAYFYRRFVTYFSSNRVLIGRVWDWATARAVASVSITNSGSKITKNNYPNCTWSCIFCSRFFLSAFLCVCVCVELFSFHLFCGFSYIWIQHTYVVLFLFFFFFKKGVFNYRVWV